MIDRAERPEERQEVGLRYYYLGSKIPVPRWSSEALCVQSFTHSWRYPHLIYRELNITPLLRYLQRLN